jgi:FlaA1/EpsC-like NDP-sugar epimerase
MFRAKRTFVFFLDLVFIAASLGFSILLRFDFSFGPEQRALFRHALPVALAVKPALLAASGMYRNIWRYASLRDACEIFTTVSAASLISASALLLAGGPLAPPHSVFVLDWLFLCFLLAASRLLWRVYRESGFLPARRQGKRTLIVGAGEAGNLLLKEIRKQADSPYQVVGFVDDDPDKSGLRLSGVRVLGGLADLGALVAEGLVEEVILAIPSGGGALAQRVVAACEKAKVRLTTLPAVTAPVDCTVSMSQVKSVEIEDLLEREPVQLDQATIRSYLTGRRVLVTGAAGSIGSEICRQVARFDPAELVLFDHAETPLFFADKELTAACPKLRIVPVIGDVKNKARVADVFGQFCPEVVFHAAAYRQVSMMEYNPAEAVLNNALGSRVVADAADRFKVQNFVLVSTDQAVNPSSVMGASKRLAEIYLQALAGASRTRFSTVRFGNLLGGNGDLMPLFKEQIEKGGPVTVADRSAVRHFMTVAEACQLVLQAGCLGAAGEIFVLDPGAPVRILSLAEELIRLSGLAPYQDIDIVFTGLKPGEKPFEELQTGAEAVRPTAHKKIRVTASLETDLRWIGARLDQLFAKAQRSDLAGLLESLREVVPEFVPRYDFAAPPPPAFKLARPDLFPPQQLAMIRGLPVVRRSEEAAA